MSKNIISGLLDLLYPPKCAFCRTLVRDGRMLCPVCETGLPRTGINALQTFPGLDGCFSPLYYRDEVRESILRYKFQGLTAYAPVYAELMADCLRQNGVQADRITWVPLSRQRRRRRGYDQAGLLAGELSKLYNTDCVRLLKKIKTNPAQSGTASAGERALNVRGVYTAMNVQPGERILLVDDIVTTGATLQEAAAQLRNAGAGKITAVTLARTE